MKRFLLYMNYSMLGASWLVFAAITLKESEWFTSAHMTEPTSPASFYFFVNFLAWTGVSCFAMSIRYLKAETERAK